MNVENVCVCVCMSVYIHIIELRIYNYRLVQGACRVNVETLVSADVGC